MSAQPPLDKDALIHEVGAAIVRNPRVTAEPWERYALVVRFDDARVQLTGFAYDDAGRARPATPNGLEIHHKLDALREATSVPDQQAWNACVVRIVRDTRKITVEFEYEHPERWDVTPQNATEIAARARP